MLASCRLCTTPEQRARFLADTALEHLRRGEPTRCLDLLGAAEASAESPESIVDVYRRSAACYAALRRPEPSLMCARHGLRTASAHGLVDGRRLSSLHSHVAVAHLDQRRYREAEAALVEQRRAIAELEWADDGRRDAALGAYYENLADLRSSRSDGSESALALLDDALEVTQEHGWSWLRPGLLSTRARLLSQDDPVSAEAAADEALRLALELGEPELLFSGHLARAEVLAGPERWEHYDRALAQVEEIRQTYSTSSWVAAQDEFYPLYDSWILALLRDGRPVEALRVVARTERLRGRAGASVDRVPGPPLASLREFVEAHSVPVVVFWLGPGYLAGWRMDRHGEVRSWVAGDPSGAAELRRDLMVVRAIAERRTEGGRSRGRRFLERWGLLRGGDDSRLEAALSRLYLRLVQPIEAVLFEDEPGRPVVLVPHGELEAVPFAALTEPDGRRWVERRASVLAESLAALDAPHHRLSEPQPLDRIGLVGDALGSQLQGGDRVARDVVEACPKARVDVRLGSEATRDQLVRALGAVGSAVHLQVHGRVDDALWERSAIELAGDERLCGTEIAELSVSAALVTLAACRAGIGTPTRDGLPSLDRTFVQAGARATVAPLWTVLDEEAADLFARFYRRLCDGSPMATSLRAAQLALLERGDPVEVWGGWQLVLGPGRRDAPETESN